MKNIDKLNELYSKISNPIDDDEVLLKLLNRFTNERELYTKLINFEKIKTNISYKAYEDDLLRENYQLKQEKLLFNSDSLGNDEWFYFNGFTDEKNLKHQFFINTANGMVHYAALSFLQACNKESLPYCFKYSLNGRDDKIVIYTTDDFIFKHLAVLKQIKPKLDEFSLEGIVDHNGKNDEGINEPPFITGKIDKWLGYGACEYKNNNLEDYHNNRNALIFSSLLKIDKTNDKNSLINLRQELVNNSALYNVDPNNFCFSAEVGEAINSLNNVVKKKKIFLPKCLFGCLAYNKNR
ncbi:MAG: hypothetical protein RR847_01890 [Bacilli bacterium]